MENGIVNMAVSGWIISTQEKWMNI